MDSKKTSPYNRPIVLSPPPLHSDNLANFLSSGHDQRQQSVGYNLQHEFETLNADLDLDLQSDQASRQQDSGSLHASSASTTAATAATAASGANSTAPGSGFLTSPVPNNGQAGLGSLLNPSSFYLPNRPQTVNDFHDYDAPTAASQFYPELLRFSSWIERLSPADSLTMIDYLCNNLPLDILMSFKSKLDSHLGGQILSPTGYSQNSMMNINLGGVGNVNDRNTAGNPANNVGGSMGLGSQLFSSSPYYNDVATDLDHLNLNDTLHQPKPRPGNQHQFQSGIGNLTNPGTNQTHFAAGSHIFPRSRPKSADPTNIKSQYYSSYLDRAKSPTNPLYEKTSFLQLAAAQSPGLAPQDESFDMSQKLGALATINSRVALDSNKKYFHDPTNRNVNSSSVPLSKKSPNSSTTAKRNIHSPKEMSYNQAVKKGVQAAQAAQAAQSHTQTQFQPQSQSQPQTPMSAQGSQNHQGQPKVGQSPTQSASMPPDVTSLELLNNIPSWLKLLRLHKYTECLKDVPWKQLVELSDEQLEEKGVKALGARRKLLKAFDVIKSEYK